jgi:hypothetical protein
MVSIPKTIGVLSCGFLLCLGLSYAAQADYAAAAADKLKADQSDRRQGGQEAGEKQMNGAEGDHAIGDDDKTIKGEVLGIEGDNMVVKGEDGNEVRLHTDETTQKAKNIVPGQAIEAKVNDQNHALSILSAQAVTDRRNDKE